MLGDSWASVLVGILMEVALPTLSRVYRSQKLNSTANERKVKIERRHYRIKC